MPDHPRVSVHIVTWNSRTHIAACLDSLVNQTYQPIEILIVDNGSVDGTVKWLEEHYPHIHLLRNTRNLGFCRAQNQAIRITDTNFVLVLNPDAILDPGWIERGVQYLQQHQDFGSFGGKILRFSYTADELKEVVKSDTLDSAGLQVQRSRHAFDRGSGQTDQGQFDQAGEIFGHSGACTLYRRTALESLRFHNEYMDEEFFAYKDDVDMAWRLQRLGWKSWYDPLARTYHHRHIRGQSATSDILIARNHQSRERFNTYYSFRNHWLLLEKNERWSTFWRDAIWIGSYELKKAAFLLVTHPSSLRGGFRAWGLSRAMRQKAALVDRHAKRSALEIRQQFFLS